MMITERLGCSALVMVFASTVATTAVPLGTAFTYHGHLIDGTVAVSGTFDFRFAVYDVPTGGAPLNPVLTNASVVVSNGLFTTALDFGEGVFDGSARWLEVGVRTNVGYAFTILSPRQELTPTPYALYAASGAPGPPGPQGLRGPAGPAGASAAPVYSPKSLSSDATILHNTSWQSVNGLTDSFDGNKTTLVTVYLNVEMVQGGTTKYFTIEFCSVASVQSGQALSVRCRDYVGSGNWVHFVVGLFVAESTVTERDYNTLWSGFGGTYTIKSGSDMRSIAFPQ